MEAKTKDGQIVCCCINNDCEENEGGYYVEIYDSDMNVVLDDFCIHTDDCDCNDWNAVENYVKQYVSTLNMTRQ